MAELYAYKGISPKVHENTYLAPGAKIIGDVELAEGVNIWHNATVRGDVGCIRIGKYSNLQDNAVIHETNKEDYATIVGEYVTVGHNAILHGCTLEDGCLVGMGAIVMDGAVIGKGSVVGAGAIVLKDTVVPPYSLVVGSPAQVKKMLPEKSYTDNVQLAQHYYDMAQEHKKATTFITRV